MGKVIIRDAGLSDTQKNQLDRLIAAGYDEADSKSIVLSLDSNIIESIIKKSGSKPSKTLYGSSLDDMLRIMNP